jgi:hypothetical protein
MLDDTRSVVPVEVIQSVTRIYGGLAFTIQTVTPDDELVAILESEDFAAEMRDERPRP